MNSKKYDYLIVGQGIAGTSLAWHLIEAGRQVLVVNDSSLPSASLVAAGIFNPLTGRKLVKTWMADTIFPYAKDFYEGLEKKLGEKLVYPLAIYRPYRSEDEQNNYTKYTSESEISQYISSNSTATNEVKGLNNPLGGLEVTGSGWVDLSLLIEKSKELFLENNQYIEINFDFKDLKFNDSCVEWKGNEIGKVILCQGVDARENSLFDWLPFNPVKGQILDVRFDSYFARQIVNQGIFILPMPEGDIYKVGATYSWHDLDWEITEDGKAYLEQRLQPLIEGSYTIHGQRAGIRPSCKDRRPLVGLHPEKPQLGVFNGLGTKGVTLAPYFANEFVEHLEHGKELNPEVNIARYFSLYYR
ncbi:NAD(P)/FAD-dependent oxidoreductase [Arundinibacter roseus]|uniref:FAD-binding oxidoreductase n=1 Tax=Arundinibacter roseus TaxID=2070510 RepID=A0A4V2X9X7_9BACT|nr:FAD-dependent oxidoreductase [Arundinibacter roseus]TDB65255.1 FAD-binding oxidoreductase [Arundinibacter roseus]